MCTKVTKGRGRKEEGREGTNCFVHKIVPDVLKVGVNESLAYTLQWSKHTAKFLNFCLSLRLENDGTKEYFCIM